MTAFFLKFMDAGISSVALLLCVIILRTAFNKTKRIPHWVNCFLWALAGIKLLIPFSPKAGFGLLFLPSEKAVPAVTVSPAPVPVTPPVSGAAPTESFSWDEVTAWIWLAGIIVLLIYCAVSTIILRKKLATAVICDDIAAPVPVKLSENAKTPFVFGVFRPRIYAPYNLNKDVMKNVIAHEAAHLQRHDNIWKPLAFFILALHWYDPIVWLGFVLFCRDTELACDEKVYGSLSKNERCQYAEALVRCSVSQKTLSVCPVAFGEVHVKKRVNNALSYKKPAVVLPCIVLIVSLVVCVCFATENNYDNGIIPESTGDVTVSELSDNNGKTDGVLSSEKEDDVSPSDETQTEKTTPEQPLPENTAEHDSEIHPQEESQITAFTAGNVSPEIVSVTPLISTAEKTETKPAAESKKELEKAVPPENVPTQSDDEDPCEKYGHDYTKSVVISCGCTRNGITAYTCSRCGDYREELVRATGHSFERIVTKEPTCTEYGTAKSSRCIYCKGTVPGTEIIEPLGHSFVDGVCTVCGYTKN